MAERVGFEPTIPGKQDTAFRERGLQPLGNLSKTKGPHMLTRLAQYPFYSGVSIAYVAIQRNLTAMLAGPKFVAPPQRSGTHTQRSGTLGFGHFSNLVLVVGSAQTLRVYNARYRYRYRNRNRNLEIDSDSDPDSDSDLDFRSSHK
jgi:hypothetical protein